MAKKSDNRANIELKCPECGYIIRPTEIKKYCPKCKCQQTFKEKK